MKNTTARRGKLPKTPYQHLCDPNLMEGVSELNLMDHYRKSKKWPGPRVCSQVRWRIFLRKQRDRDYFDALPDADTAIYAFAH